MKIRRINKEEFTEITSACERCVKDEDGTEYDILVNPASLVDVEGEDCEFMILKTINQEVVIYYNDDNIELMYVVEGE